MGIAEIIILIVGAILFTVSFFISDKSGGSASLDEEQEAKIIHKMVEEEMDKFRYDIDEITQESFVENREKMERALDRITNEKMNAVSEYSDTVMEQIHKNHEEAVFLYDMLNNKHSQVKNTAAELNQITKTAKMATEETQKAVEEAHEVKKQVEEASVFEAVADSFEEPKADPFETAQIQPLKEETTFETLELPSIDVDAMFEEIVEEKKVEEPVKPAKKKAKVEKTPVVENPVDLLFNSDNNSANSNDRILQLHREGKSNMAIAKELGLGLGEVKLVLDLYEGV